MSRQGVNNKLNELEIKVIDALSIGGRKTSHNIAAILNILEPETKKVLDKLKNEKIIIGLNDKIENGELVTMYCKKR
jgi:DNA-binding Lrp family transcriptional regulator